MANLLKRGSAALSEYAGKKRVTLRVRSARVPSKQSHRARHAIPAALHVRRSLHAQAALAAPASRGNPRRSSLLGARNARPAQRARRAERQLPSSSGYRNWEAQLSTIIERTNRNLANLSTRIDQPGYGSPSPPAAGYGAPRARVRAAAARAGRPRPRRGRRAPSQDAARPPRGRARRAARRGRGAAAAGRGRAGRGRAAADDGDGISPPPPLASAGGGGGALGGADIDAIAQRVRDEVLRHVRGEPRRRQGRARAPADALRDGASATSPTTRRARRASSADVARASRAHDIALEALQHDVAGRRSLLAKIQSWIADDRGVAKRASTRRASGRDAAASRAAAAAPASAATRA